MCLTNINKEEEAAIIKKLSANFPCWKILKSKGGRTWYHQNGEQLLTRGKIHKAKRCGKHRAYSTYKPGFHAYISYKDAVITFNYMSPATNIYIVKFWAKKADIIKVGEDSCYPKIIAVAVNRITRK